MDLKSYRETQQRLIDLFPFLNKVGNEAARRFMSEPEFQELQQEWRDATGAVGNFGFGNYLTYYEPYDDYILLAEPRTDGEAQFHMVTGADDDNIAQEVQTVPEGLVDDYIKGNEAPLVAWRVSHVRAAFDRRMEEIRLVIASKREEIAKKQAERNERMTKALSSNYPEICTFLDEAERSDNEAIRTFAEGVRKKMSEAMGE